MFLDMKKGNKMISKNVVFVSFEIVSIVMSLLLLVRAANTE